MSLTPRKAVEALLAAHEKAHGHAAQYSIEFKRQVPVEGCGSCSTPAIAASRLFRMHL